MRSHMFINSLLYLLSQLLAKKAKPRKTIEGFGVSLSVLFIDKCYVSQAIQLIMSLILGIQFSIGSFLAESYEEMHVKQ